ncbi:hypothetical protein Moror_2419 [Moniliophthora roreri MCA 2997]|uniref:Uncharacterized protein n=1 Tax=Moniliophthora roreri (strain MCA 2997) TaxID=1381753 RepID=V2WW23_MONRO|nr:hypothetical protein Moror_2419 [Moniliophthora roreri MCA 2997]
MAATSDTPSAITTKASPIEMRMVRWRFGRWSMIGGGGGGGGSGWVRRFFGFDPSVASLLTFLMPQSTGCPSYAGDRHDPNETLQPGGDCALPYQETNKDGSCVIAGRKCYPI